MAKKERKPDTLKQKKTRHYVKVLLGIYLIYTAYSIVRDLQSGVSADCPVLFYAAAVLFASVGAVLAVSSFRAAMRISAEELKQMEKADGAAVSAASEEEVP